MKRFTIAALLIFTSCQQPVYAQTPTEYSLKVTSTELELIGKALGTQPYNDVVPLMSKLRQQVMEQQKPKPEDKPAEPKKE